LGTLPTLSPAPLPVNTTTAPSASSSNVVQATPFGVSYIISEGASEPNDFEVVFASEITMAHVEETVRSNFEGTFGVVVDSFQSEIIGSTTTPNVVIQYSVSVTFSESSDFIPLPDEVDTLVNLAFLDPPVQDLIADLRALPPETPFSQTESVEYVKMEIRNGERVVSLSASQISLITGASAMVLIAVCYALMRSKARRNAARAVAGTKFSRVQEIPVLMPGRSYGGISMFSNESENLMQFRDDTGSTTSSGSAFGSLSVDPMASEQMKMYAQPVESKPSWQSSDDLRRRQYASEERQSRFARPTSEKFGPFHSIGLEIQPF